MLEKIIKKLKSLWSDKDERNLIVNVLLAFAVKGISLMVSMFSMPLYIRYFNNNDVLGVWYTILSILSWISICDLGLGNGLRNYFTIAYAQNERTLAKKYVSSTYVFLTAIIVPIIILGCVGVSLVDLNGFFNISENLIDRGSLELSMIILLAGLGINFVLKSINSVIYAIQKSSLNNIISLIVSMIPLLYILIAPSGTLSENLIRLSVVHILAINLPLLFATLVIFAGRYKEYAPSVKYAEVNTAKTMLGMGMKFFGAQMFFMALMSTNELFITRMFSSDAVVEYSAYYKIFMLVGSLFMLALTPLWSKITKDLAEKKYIKIKKTNRFLYVVSALAVLVEVLMIPILQWVFDIWLGDGSPDVDLSTAVIFALFGGLYIFNIVLTTVANGMGELKTQAVFYGVGAALKIPVTMLLKSLYTHWSVVVVYNCVILLAFCSAQIFWVEMKINRLINSEEN